MDTPDARLHLDIQAQPDDTTCGPTCLQAIYRYYNDPISLSQVIQEVHPLDSGGTLAVFLGCHALKRGFAATIFTYNMQVFDPTWFVDGQPVDLAAKLERQSMVKKKKKLSAATRGYLDFLGMGGKLQLEDLTAALLRKYLKRGVPIITGLSSTYLYREAREIGEINRPDDVVGEPAGHFVVLHGYSKEHRTVMVADPYLLNPMTEGQKYEVSIDRVIGSILLGVLTYDANLLVIEPRHYKRG